MRRISFGVVLGVLLAPLAAEALIVNDENADANYRFEAGTYPGSPVPNDSPSYIAAGYDLSGVGWGSNSTQSFTMINDQYFVYATHYPPPSSTMNFYSPTNGLVTYTIDTTFNLALEYPFAEDGNHLKSDLSIGRLTTNLDPADNIAFYPILDLPTGNDYLGQDLLVYGWSAAVGTGTIDGLGSVNLYWDANTPDDPADDVLNTETNFDNLADTFVMSFTQGAAPGEALLQLGDSGSPSFVIWNGSLALVGVHSAVDGLTSYDSFLPAYLNVLETAGIAFTTVPEPSVTGLMGAAVFFMASRRGRKAAR
jgi:hypothetical protein